MTQVRYFAAAEEAAGRATEARSELTLGQLRAGLQHDHAPLAAILDRCAILVNGARHDDDTRLDADAVVDILPPFAGG